jgi:hypothetical protein
MVEEGKWTSLPTALNEAEAETLWEKNLYVIYRAVAPE